MNPNGPVLTFSIHLFLLWFCVSHSAPSVALTEWRIGSPFSRRGCLRRVPGDTWGPRCLRRPCASVPRPGALSICRSLGFICLSLYFNDLLDQTIKYFRKVHSLLPIIHGYFLNKMYIELVRHEFSYVCQLYQKSLKLSRFGPFVLENSISITQTK